jgi:hypothetical protein
MKKLLILALLIAGGHALHAQNIQPWYDSTVMLLNRSYMYTSFLYEKTHHYSLTDTVNGGTTFDTAVHISDFKQRDKL